MPEEENHEPPPSQRLTNDDFRKLLMTPRSTPALPATPAGQSLGGASIHDEKPSMRSAGSSSGTGGGGGGSSGGDDRAERRRKKKSFYAKLKKQEDDKMAELAKKYRDRAGERREGQNPDYQSEDPLATASGYRAVAPDLKSGLDAAERRKQMIQESKFLGGDMAHTHLVKGLDYALLQKVRSEIQAKEAEEEEEMEKLAKNSGGGTGGVSSNTIKKEPVSTISSSSKRENKQDVDDEMHFKTSIGRQIYRAAFPPKEIEKNDMFLPGRMAYVIELEDQYADTDIPTTLVRSCAEVPAIEIATTLTTNDIVINKLAQILSYLRSGGRHGKKNKKMKKSGQDGGQAQSGGPRKGHQDDSIYGDIGDYIPTNSRESRKEEKRRPYFDDTDLMPAPPAPPKLSADRGDETASGNSSSNSNQMGRKQTNSESKAQQLLTRLTAEPVGYSECYPGLEEMQDAIEDSDEEADYTKMDLGNKKGPVGRWDFDSQEEYGDYMNRKEALPKAAFQYGLKMADGRKTRKHNRERNEKAELDREWQKIQNIIQKRKIPGDDGLEFKKPKY